MMNCCRFFHGFARHSDAVELLKGKPGYYLIRYSESQLKDGFFAFNVNKGSCIYQNLSLRINTGRRDRDVIENYSLRYYADLGCFIFRNKKYKTLREFVSDAEYSSILRT